MTPICYAMTGDLLVVRVRGGVLEIRGHPDPQAMMIQKVGTQSTMLPDFRLVYPAGLEPDPALVEFRKTLPDEIARILEPFQSHQWNLLELLTARPEAIQLASHNPVLAYLLANNDYFRKNLTKPPAYLAQWRLDYTQERLLEWLGFPAKPAVVKLFRKIDPSSLMPASARLLRIALNMDPNLLSLLAHHRRINRGMLDLVVLPDLRPFLTTDLLAEVAEIADGKQVDAPDEKVLRYVKAMDEMGYIGRIKPIKSLKKLDALSKRAQEAFIAEKAAREAARQARKQQLRAEENERVGRERRCERAQRSIPPPPDTKDFVRLCRALDVVEEGAKQKHCVGHMALKVATGDAFIYRVLQPERATLSLKMGEDGQWKIGELKLACDRQAGKATQAHVVRWLARHARSTRALRAQWLKREEALKAPSAENDTPF